MIFTLKNIYPTSSAVLEKVKTGVFNGGQFCLWKLLQSMGFSYKRQTVNDSFMNNMTLLNDVHIYKQYTNYDKKKLYTQTKLWSMHITLTNIYGWTTTAKVDGRYQVGKVKD